MTGSLLSRITRAESLREYHRRIRREDKRRLLEASQAMLVWNLRYHGQGDIAHRLKHGKSIQRAD